MVYRTGLDRPPTEDPVPRALAGAIPAGCPLQSELLERAAARGRLTVAEVGLGHRAVLTAARTVGLR